MKNECHGDCHDDCPICAEAARLRGDRFEPTPDMQRYLPTFGRFTSATRAAHARAIAESAAPVLAMSDADLAEVADAAMRTPQAIADVDNAPAESREDGRHDAGTL